MSHTLNSLRYTRTVYSVNTGVAGTESAGNVSSKFRDLLLGNRGDQGGFDRRAGAALTASVPIQQGRAKVTWKRPACTHAPSVNKGSSIIARLVVRGSIKAGEPSGHIKSMAATTPLTFHSRVRMTVSRRREMHQARWFSHDRRGTARATHAART
jgi:hypothetical protein